MKYFSCVNRPIQSLTPSGRKEVEDYQFLPDSESGDRKLSEVGKTSLYEKAQLSRPDDLYTILKKSGVEPTDVESLRVSKEYAETLVDDFCEAPRSLLEAHETIHRAEQSFDQLPLEVKSEFDNSAGKMMKSLLDGTFEKRMSKFVPPKKSEEVKEEKQDEVK